MQPIYPNKFDIIVADPPWAYNSRCQWSETRFGGGTTRQYKTISLQAIADLPVKDIVSDNAMLFLWVTHPYLEECFEVIHGWGFEYITNACNWMKLNTQDPNVFFGVGYYQKSCSELCLLTKRGKTIVPANNSVSSGILDIETLIDPQIMLSVSEASKAFDEILQNLKKVIPAKDRHKISLDKIIFYIKDMFLSRFKLSPLELATSLARSISYDLLTPVQAHSKKPEEFQDGLDLMYPTSNKIELFARRHRPGWLCIGNETTGRDITEDLIDIRDNKMQDITDLILSFAKKIRRIFYLITQEKAMFDKMFDLKFKTETKIRVTLAFKGREYLRLFDSQEEAANFTAKTQRETEDLIEKYFRHVFNTSNGITTPVSNSQITKELDLVASNTASTPRRTEVEENTNSDQPQSLIPKLLIKPEAVDRAALANRQAVIHRVGVRGVATKNKNTGIPAKVNKKIEERKAAIAAQGLGTIQSRYIMTEKPDLPIDVVIDPIYLPEAHPQAMSAIIDFINSNKATPDATKVSPDRISHLELMFFLKSIYIEYDLSLVQIADSLNAAGLWNIFSLNKPGTGYVPWTASSVYRFVNKHAAFTENSYIGKISKMLAEQKTA